MGKWICWYVSTIGRGVRICIKLYANTSYCKYYIKNPYPRGFDNTNTGWGGEHSLECQNSNSLVNITLQLNWMSHHSHDSFFSVWMFKIQSYSILTKEKKKKCQAAYWQGNYHHYAVNNRGILQEYGAWR